MRKRYTRNVLVHMLPFLHLCACLIIWAAQLQTGLDYLFFVDFPISAFLFGAAYNFNHPVLLYAVFGTLWWYLLSRAAEIIGTSIVRSFRGAAN
jgi:hypothetical protein